MADFEVNNNPTPERTTVVERDSGGWTVAIVVLVLLVLFLLFGLPALRGGDATTDEGGDITETINVEVPSVDTDSNGAPESGPGDVSGDGLPEDNS